MKNNFYREGFTLIEILVVATIIVLLATGTTISYSGFSKQSRDSKRKADLEQIRSAIEMYRSNNTNNSYPATAMNCSSSGGITEGTNTYLSTIPKDPKCTTQSYYYSPVDSAGGACDGSASDPCVNYTLGAKLENGGTDCATNSCGSGVNCNYCVGPYGQK
ncbi:type II secretion system protein [Candidatus Roizmanbacteria bacterium]|jgi:general secretion pathway protein G|nr:type II secretion system protein [Candidatus Roizmanbacteria bacterium]